MYELGEEVKKNLEKAAEWYTKAAEQGDIVSQRIFAETYGRGNLEKTKKLVAIQRTPQLLRFLLE